MLFLWFAFMLQVSGVLHLSIHRILCLLLNTKRSSIRRMADANFVSQIVNLLFSVLLLPVTCVAVCVQVLIRQVFFWLCVCVCECELDAAGVALSQIDKHNMRHYSKRLSRVCACVNVKRV